MVALVQAGSISGLINLVDVLRDEYEQSREERKQQIEKRKEGRYPLDDTTVWEFVTELHGELNKSIAAKNSVMIAQNARKLFDATNGNALVELPEFKPPKDIDGIRIRMRIPSNSQARRLQSAISDAWIRKRDAILANKRIEALDADDDIEKAIGEYVLNIIEEIEGIDGVTKENLRDNLDALDAEGIVSHLYTACRHFMSLPRKKALLCGVPPPLI